MISNIWNTIVYEPLYNLLVFLLSIVPGHSAALAIITLTVIVRLILYPLYKKTIRDQFVMKQIQGELEVLQKKYKEDRTTLGQKLLEVYKKNKVNPFSSIFLLLFVQLPILFGLIFVFTKGFLQHEGHLYSFITYPEIVLTGFLGLDLLVKGSIIMSILAGVAQYIHSKVTDSLNKNPQNSTNKERSFQEEFARSMRFQMLYIIPVIITISAFYFPSAIALYWITNSLFSIAQEYKVRKEINMPQSLVKA